MKNENTFNKLIVIIFILISITLPILIFIYSKKKKDSQTTEFSNVTELEKKHSALPNASNTINLSLVYIQNNMPGKANHILQNYILTDSSNAIIYNNLGVANNLLKNYKVAIYACQKAFQIDTTFTLAKNNLNWAYQQVTVIRKNIDSLILLKGEISRNDIPLKLGLYYLQIGEYDSSIMMFQKGQFLFPQDETYPINIGSALMMKNEYQKALIFFQKALEINPNNQLGINNLSWAKEAINEQSK